MNVLLITEKDASANQIKAVISEKFGECEFVNCTPGLVVLDITRSFQPDLTVIQLNYRDAEAPDLVRHLKSLDCPGYVFVIIESDNYALVEQAVHAGVDDFIKGGFDERELSIRLARFTLIQAEARPEPEQHVRAKVQPEPKKHVRAEARPEPEQHEDRQEVKSAKRGPGYRGVLTGAARLLGNAAFGCLLLLMAGLAFFLVQGKYLGGVPSVFGHQMYIVLSGSMNPEFDTGSLAFVRAADPESIQVGDIITYGNPGGGMLTTHRVVDVQNDGGLKFTTRGDANNMDDPRPVPAEHVVGRVQGTVPYLGYLMNFAQTRQGLIFLVFIPGALVIIYEVRNIYRYLGEAESKKKSQGNGNPRVSYRSKTRSRLPKTKETLSPGNPSGMQGDVTAYRARG